MQDAVKAIRAELRDRRSKMRELGHDIQALERAEATLLGNPLREDGPHRSPRTNAENEARVIAGMRKIGRPAKSVEIARACDDVGPATVSACLKRMESTGKVKRFGEDTKRLTGTKRYGGRWELSRTLVRPGDDKTVDAR